MENTLQEYTYRLFGYLRTIEQRGTNDFLCGLVMQLRNLAELGGTMLADKLYPCFNDRVRSTFWQHHSVSGG